VRLVAADALPAEVAAEIASVRHRHHNAGVVAPERLHEPIAVALAAAGLRATDHVQHLDHDEVPIFGPEAVKGLEFDGVVVVNPHEILGTDSRGARLLYVALTRAVQTVHLVGDAPVPAILGLGSAVNRDAGSR
jgi:DNA helicase IV